MEEKETVEVVEETKNNVPEKNDSMGIAGFVLGILSLIAWLLPLIGYPVSIVGLVLSIKARKNTPSGFTTAGMVLSIIGLCFTALNSFAGMLLRLATL